MSYLQIYSHHSSDNNSSSNSSIDSCCHDDGNGKNTTNTKIDDSINDSDGNDNKRRRFLNRCPVTCDQECQVDLQYTNHYNHDGDGGNDYEKNKNNYVVGSDGLKDEVRTPLIYALIYTSFSLCTSS
jgi:hypothetical protein